MLLFEFEDDDLALETEHDFCGLDFVFYDNPVDHYSVKNIGKKIGSFSELEYYAEVLFYLNPDIDQELLKGIFCWLGSRDSAKSIRTYGKPRIEYAINKIFFERPKPFCRRMRRVVFNPLKIMSMEEKMSISSHIIKRSPSFYRRDIKRAIMSLRSRREVITVERISREILCSKSTVSRLIDKELSVLIKGFNRESRKELKIRVLMENIELLTSNGDAIKIRALKEMTSIRDYQLIKEAINLYLLDH